MNPSALNNYIVEVQHKPFEWGVHDCLIFSNTAWHRAFGFGWADDWLGKYMVGGKPISQRTAKSVFGYANLDAALQDRLKRVDHVPPRGALVTSSKIERSFIGSAFGISIGLNAAFVSATGLVYIPITQIQSAWVSK